MHEIKIFIWFFVAQMQSEYTKLVPEHRVCAFNTRNLCRNLVNWRRIRKSEEFDVVSNETILFLSVQSSKAPLECLRT